MDEGSSKEPDFAGSSSPTALEASEPEKSKPKRKKKGCTCKGFASESSIVKRRKKFAGSPFFKEQQAWAMFIRKQREDLRKVKHVIDDKAPRLNVSGVYDTELLKAAWTGLKSAFELNQNILKTLHLVTVLHGKTDTFGYNYSRPMSSNYDFRREQAKSIEKQNQIMLKIIKNSKTRMMTAKQYAEEYKLHEALLESSSQFPLWWKMKQVEQAGVEIPPPVHYFKQHVTEKSAKYADKRPRVSLEISIRNGGVLGKMVAMLYSDYVPMTVKNFLAFCDPKAPLTYKGNLFYLIFQNYYCQTGDVVENKGFGGTSIYGPYFGNEDFTLKHRERGMLTMHAQIPNRNASQFLITFRKLESLDGQNVAFGKIVKGLHVLDAIESIGSKKKGRPKVEVYISDCDEI